MQVETIQAVLVGMKERLTKVQQAVSEQLHQYQHLADVAPGADGAEAEGESAAEPEGGSAPSILDIGAGPARHAEAADVDLDAQS